MAGHIHYVPLFSCLYVCILMFSCRIYIFISLSHIPQKMLIARIVSYPKIVFLFFAYLKRIVQLSGNTRRKMTVFIG